MVKCVNDKMDLKLPSYFTFDNKKIHIIFCIIHTIKCMRNNLISNGNFIRYPSLSLSNGKTLNSGQCDFKWMRKLCHKFKEELVTDAKMFRQAKHPHNLKKSRPIPTSIF